MHVLLTIGFERILLPSEQGLQTIIKALSGAYRIKGGSYDHETGLGELDGRVEVAVKMLPNLRITTRHKAPVVHVENPEVLPPADEAPRRRAAGALPGGYPTLEPHRHRMLLREGGLS